MQTLFFTSYLIQISKVLVQNYQIDDLKLLNDTSESITGRRNQLEGRWITLLELLKLQKCSPLTKVSFLTNNLWLSRQLNTSLIFFFHWYTWTVNIQLQPIWPTTRNVFHFNNWKQRLTRIKNVKLLRECFLHCCSFLVRKRALEFNFRKSMYSANSHPVIFTCIYS